MSKDQVVSKDSLGHRRWISTGGLPMSHYYPKTRNRKRVIQANEELLHQHLVEYGRLEPQPEVQASEPKREQPSKSNQRMYQRRIRGRKEKQPALKGDARHAQIMLTTRDLPNPMG